MFLLLHVANDLVHHTPSDMLCQLLLTCTAFPKGSKRLSKCKVINSQFGVTLVKMSYVRYFGASRLLVIAASEPWPALAEAGC